MWQSVNPARICVTKMNLLENRKKCVWVCEWVNEWVGERTHGNAIFYARHISVKSRKELFNTSAYRNTALTEREKKTLGTSNSDVGENENKHLPTEHCVLYTLATKFLPLCYFLVIFSSCSSFFSHFYFAFRLIPLLSYSDFVYMFVYKSIYIYRW